MGTQTIPGPQWRALGIASSFFFQGVPSCTLVNFLPCMLESAPNWRLRGDPLYISVQLLLLGLCPVNSSHIGLSRVTPALRPGSSPRSQLGSWHVLPSVQDPCLVLADGTCLKTIVLYFVLLCICFRRGRGCKSNPCYSILAQSGSPTVYILYTL